MFKRLGIFLALFLTAASLLSAASWSVEAGTGYRFNVTMKRNQIRFFDFAFNYDTLSIYARTHSFNTHDLTVDYELRCKRFMVNRFILHTRYINEEGGYSDIGYEFGVCYDSDHFLLAAALGARGAISYYEYANNKLFAISPLVSVKAAVFFKYASLSIYGEMASRYENNWKALTLFGSSLEVFINDNSSVMLDVYTQASEYLIDPYFIPYTSAVRLAYKYRSN